LYRKSLDTNVLQTKTCDYLCAVIEEMHNLLPKNEKTKDVIGHAKYIMRKHQQSQKIRKKHIGKINESNRIKKLQDMGILSKL